MKTKHSIRLLAVAVLASTLLLGACGNKKEEAKNDNANKTTQTTSSSKASSLISKLHKVNLIKQASQLMTQRLTANYKTSRQNTINVTKVF